MTTQFVISSAGKPDGELVTFGPINVESSTHLAIASNFTRRVTYPALGITCIIECAFTGDRIEVSSLSIEKVEAYITTKALTLLALPQVIRALAEDAIPNSQTWSKPRAPGDNRPTSPEFLAQIYWFEHVSWGSPRASIMKYMGWSRTNANFHITKFSKQIAMPGAHSSTQVLAQKS